MKVSCIALGIIICSSITFGGLVLYQRHLDSLNKEQTQAALVENCLLSIDEIKESGKFDDFEFELEEGPDFLIWRANNQKDKSGFGLYIGSDPSFIKKIGFMSVIAAQRSYFGEFPVLWFEEILKDGRFWLEGIAYEWKYPGGARTLTKYKYYRHIWVFGDKQKVLQILTNFERLRDQPVAVGGATQFKR